jgi:hypothetical protein
VFRDLEFGTVTGTCLKAFQGDSGHSGEEARKGTETGRMVLALFLVHLLREGRKGFARRHLDRKTPWRLVKKYCRAAGIDPDRLGQRGIGIHSLRKTAINDAIRNGAAMHVGQPYCLLQQPCPGFFLARSADDTSARALFSTSLHLEQVAADLEIRRILSTAGKPRGWGKLERFFESLAQACLGRLLTPIARVLTINNLHRVTPAVVEVARQPGDRHGMRLCAYELQ